MPLFTRFPAALFLALALAAPCIAADNSKTTYDDPEAAAKDADFAAQGEYAAEIKDGDKTITYYISDKGKTEKYHKCSGEQDATVTGKVVEKDKKKTIEDAKVEKK